MANSMLKNLFIFNFRMKKFKKRIIVYLIVSFGILAVSSEAVFHFPALAFYGGYSKRWVEVRMRVKASNRENHSHILYVGDSVAGQFYPFSNNDKLNNKLTSNANVTSFGNYILVYNALRKNKGIKEVVYLTIPQALELGLQSTRTCNNLIKPFYSFANIKHFDQDILSLLSSHPLSYLYIFPFVKVLPFSEVDFSAPSKTGADHQISDDSMKWIKKISELCDESGVQFYLISPPVVDSMRMKTDDWSDMRAQCMSAGLEHIFSGYFSTIRYFDDKHSKDGTHWNSEFIGQMGESVRVDIP